MVSIWLQLAAPDLRVLFSFLAFAPYLDLLVF